MNKGLVYLIIGVLYVTISTPSMADPIPIVNLNYDTAQGLAFEAGFMYGPSENAGLALSMEPGVMGTKLHIGYEQTLSAAVGYISLFRVSWTELQMYRNSNQFVAGTRYSGVEFTYVSLPALFQLGIYLDPVSHNRLVSLGFGIGI